ncbi:hypothetical protein [Methylosinus sp. Sm6]|uniref:hypothetical protein n=1 Tax=Methylosinus sp. Sm6 TaxID=2866948 RepID=UPI001C998A7C|nr:hypothetical protein [Methylosinus sp. Sm6]MBY6242667.1 hypothetical protein [Methylosinus sp. Sm6]
MTYNVAHDLCFIVHDVLVQFLVSGEASGAFVASISLDGPAEAHALKASTDIFEWLDVSGRVKDRANILKTIILPAVLSDMLHCIYEALQSSRKGKLNVSYILLRKPLQESLFVLESIALDEMEFASKLTTDPLRLRPKNAGGPEGQASRIKLVLEAIGATNLFDANYIAQLRYVKTDDGFDGVCNKAMHLFTEHPAIKTEILNINFIFSDYESKLSQWSYLYTRLPYLLIYTLRLVEHIAAGIVPTHPDYLDDISRRIAAGVLLWGRTLPSGYETAPLIQFIAETARQLETECASKGWRSPTRRDLRRMAFSGAVPGESAADVKERYASFARLAELDREAFLKASAASLKTPTSTR